MAEFVLQDDLETQLYGVEQKTRDIITSFESTTLTLIQKLETQVESLEKQLAYLILGFGEQTIAIEALVAQVVFKTDDEKKAFIQSVEDSRTKLMNTLQQGLNVDGMDDADKNVASALEQLVNAKLSDQAG